MPGSEICSKAIWNLLSGTLRPVLDYSRCGMERQQRLFFTVAGTMRVSMLEPLDLRIDFCRDALDEHQLPDCFARRLIRVAVEQRRELREAHALVVAQFGE